MQIKNERRRRRRKAKQAKRKESDLQNDRCVQCATAAQHYQRWVGICIAHRSFKPLPKYSHLFFRFFFDFDHIKLNAENKTEKETKLKNWTNNESEYAEMHRASVKHATKLHNNSWMCAVKIIEREIENTKSQFKKKEKKFLFFALPSSSCVHMGTH